MLMYSLFDVKLREFGPIVLANTDEAVVRALRDGVPGTGSTVDKHRADFHLMFLGSFDAEIGKIVPEEIPRLVDTVETLLKEVPNGGQGA